MAKKLTFDKLPAAVEKILEILSSEGSEHTALPEIVQRITLLESKIDYLQRTVSPDRPVMDMQTVCKVLRLRPKAVNDLAVSGVLPSREQGKRTVFYEDGVVRYFMTQPAWSAAAATASKPFAEKSASSEVVPESGRGVSAPAAVATGGRQRVDINAAGEILGRSVGAVYQLTSTGKVPFYKDGAKVYFYTDELREWAKTHPGRKRRKNL